MTRTEVETAVTQYELGHFHQMPAGRCAELMYEAAKAWLAEHPADDGELVTVEWFESVGGKTADDKTCSIDFPYRGMSLVYYQLGVISSEPQVWIWSENGGVICECRNTRGHVRRLCALLGIPLSEASTQ